jgi:carboxyl-terminal processing protease
MRRPFRIGHALRALSFVGLAVAGPGAVSVAHAEDPLDCNFVPSVMDRFLDAHYSFRAVDTKLADHFVDLYLDRLDPSRSLLLESEAKSLEPRLRSLLTEVRTRRCDGIGQIHKEMLVRHAENEAFTKKFLKDPKFKLDKSTALELDPDKRERPKTPAERDELRRKLLQFQLANYVMSGTKQEEGLEKLVHRYELIHRRVAKMDDEDKYSGFLDAFASALDPHSEYFSQAALEDFSIGMKLSLDGIGAVLRSQDGYTVVNEIVPGGAADRQGQLRTKDKIVAVAQGTEAEAQNVIDEDLRDVVRLIRGKKGTQVKLTVLRQTEKAETLNIVITRDKVDLKEQAAKLSWQELEVPGKPGRKLKLAVIDLPSFYGGRDDGARQCTDDLRALLSEAKEKNADGLLLDLSRNGGGLLQAAVEIGGYFVRTGAIVGVGARERATDPLEDNDPQVQWAGPLVVLTSRFSASASEIVTGALKDYRRAIIVGDDRTFGKGTVQNVIDLPPGFGAVKVTTAMFFRPGGESTQNTGVEADIVLPSVVQHEDFGERSMPYALPPAKTPAFLSSSVNAPAGGAGAWSLVPPERMATLGKHSAERVAKNTDFAEVATRIEKAKKAKGVVKLGDLMATADKPKDGAGADDAEDEEEKRRKKGELTPQAKEALNILAELAAGN